MSLSAEELAREIRDDILSGRLKPGDRLPSLNKLVETRDVGKGAAQEAIKQLRGEGLIESAHGSANYVRLGNRLIRKAFPESAEPELSPGQSLRVTRIDEVPAPVAIAEALRVDIGTPVVLRSIDVSYAGRVVLLEDTYFPIDLARGTLIVYHDPGHGGTRARLAEQGAEPTRFSERVIGRAATPEEAERLGLKSGTAMVLDVLRRGFAGERCVELTRSTLDASSFELAYALNG
jgi:GntR family transcriptional regulator